MKSLANATNGVMCLADSFAMAIFKQSFLRTLQPGPDGGLKMGFNATFDVQVRPRPPSDRFRWHPLTLLVSAPRRLTDDQGAQDFGRHRPRHLG